MRPTSPAAATTRTQPLAQLLSVVRSATRTPAEWNAVVDRVADDLRGVLPTAGEVLALLPSHARLGCHRSQVLHVEPDGSFSVVALVAAPGQATSVHDHSTWCVVAVVGGAVTEETFALDGEGRALVATASSTAGEGAISASVPPGDIHRAINEGDSVNVSLHIYGTDISRIGTSVRRVYEPPLSRVHEETRGVQPDVR